MQKQKRIAVLAAGSARGETGGAERLYHGLVEALRSAGCLVELISTQADESSFEQILQNYERCALIDLSAYDMVVSTKAPTYAAHHPNHVLYLMHTTRVFYDMFEETFPRADDSQRERRQQIHFLDTRAMSLIGQRFAIGHEVAQRLQAYNGLQAEVLHPPLVIPGLGPGSMGDYFFLPGRLHRWKRVDLAIRAVQASALPLRLVIAGTGEAEEELRRLAAGDTRIEFLGRISDEALVRQYAECLAVLFLPQREDYGYVTLEAFACAKAVITFIDAGEPTRFVEHGKSGLICPPDAAALREAMERLHTDRALTQAMGERGGAVVPALRWEQVADRLLTAGGLDRPSAGRPAADSSQHSVPPLRVAVLDMQPIIPAVGGGRIRLLGLYHALAENVEVRYIGSYDWPGEARRSHQITPGLHETDIPLSEAHHARALALGQRCGGKVVIDVSFALQGHLSPSFVAGAREAIDWAQVVVFSHPWVYPLVADALKAEHVVVYDSQNVEGLLRAQILDQRNPVESEILHCVVATERDVGVRADLVLACSQQDVELFHRFYGFPYAKMRVAPNGVMTQTILPCAEEHRRAARARLKLGLETPVAMFIGSDYAPNAEAGRFVVEQLAPLCPHVQFVIAGGVGTRLGTAPGNVLITGPVDEDVKLDCLRAADVALNPMFSGSGTNVKMFDFMAAALPVLTTEVGARGINRDGRDCLLVLKPDAATFAQALDRVLSDRTLIKSMGGAARCCVEESYAWSRISAQLGQLFKAGLRWHRRQRPRFSVVVPSYERHRQLEELMASLQAQSFRSFEVVVIDQSATPWPQRARDFGFPLHYLHTDVKGATRARNTGAYLAMGDIIAFTDDDCRPLPDWLESASPFFDEERIVGLEGLIESSGFDDPNLRPVTNVSFEGMGFMTANLMARSSDFRALEGFDLSFDRPHFREDTDFGWRLQERGLVPFARQVRVTHPPQPRSIERESHDARARFFEKDALLFAKYPARYRKLFMAEEHWKRTVGFRDHFLRGGAKYNVDLGEFERWFAEHPFGVEG